VTTDDTFFTRAGDGPALIGASCAECGAMFYPARPVCGVCGSLIEDDAVPIGRSASLQRFTISNVAPAGIAAPYVLGMVRLPEGPELLARIVPGFDDWSRLASGQRLALRAEGAGFYYAADEEPEHD
jgi:uncharacterized OB-fold protein